MIRSSIQVNTNLLTEINKFNQFNEIHSNNLNFKNSIRSTIIDLSEKLDANIDIITNSLETPQARQALSLFSKTIKNSFSEDTNPGKLATIINYHINNYFLKIPEISINILSHLTNTNYATTCQVLRASRLASPFFNSMASSVLREWLQNRTINPVHIGIVKASDTISFSETYNLTKLDLTNIQFTEEQLIQLAKNCPNITVITFPKGATENSIIEFIKICRKLTEINFASPSGITDKCVKEIAKNCFYLKNIDMAYSALTDESIIEIARNCPHLREIYLQETKITDKSLLEFAKHSHELNEIDCEDTAITETGATELIKNCNSLKSIGLNNTEVNGDIIIKSLKDLPELRKSKITKLELGGIGVSENGIKMLSNLHHLEEIAVTDFAISYTQLVDLATALPKLNDCHFDFDEMPGDDYDSFFEKFPDITSSY